jgi:hypothetical protein
MYSAESTLLRLCERNLRNRVANIEWVPPHFGGYTMRYIVNHKFTNISQLVTHLDRSIVKSVFESDWVNNIIIVASHHISRQKTVFQTRPKMN